jgi:hypothetical protein
MRVALITDFVRLKDAKNMAKIGELVPVIP